MAAKCAACGAPVTTTACGYCGEPVTLEERKTASAGGGGPCPRCDDRQLSPRRFQGLAMATCLGCKGIWLGREELEGVLRRHHQMGLAPSGEDPPKQAFSGPIEYLRCPTCTGLMNRENYRKVSGVIIDVCKEHGAWLDGGELQALQRFAADGGFEKAAQSAAIHSPEKPKHDLEKDIARVVRRVGIGPFGGFGGI